MKSTATIKLTLENRGTNPKQPLKIRITYGRDHRLYSINYDGLLTKEEFNNDKLKITKEAKDAASKAIDIAKTIVDSLGADFSFKAFTKEYRSQLYHNGITKDIVLFSTIAEDYIGKLTKPNSQQSYTTAVRWIEKFKPNVRITDMDKDFFKDFEQFVRGESRKRGKEVSVNTLGIYMRSIRAIYYKGLEMNNLPNSQPFKGVNTSSRRRQNFSLSEEAFQCFLNYQPQNKKEEYGKDFFLLSVALSGAHIGDIISLKNHNINNGVISFVRRKTEKTGIVINLPLTNKATEVFNKYGQIDYSRPDDYIFPYLSNDGSAKHNNYKIKDITKKIDKGLASISSALGVQKLCSSMSRHTFATLGTMGYGPLNLIEMQKQLGHADSKTTSIYLDSLTKNVLEKTKDFIDNLMK